MALVPYKYCNPYLGELTERSLYVGEHNLTIYQDKNLGIGFTLWDCVFIL